MSMKKKVLIVIIAIIVVLGVGVYIYFDNKPSTPDITADDAQKIALEDAKENKDSILSISTSYDSEDNEYEIEFISNDGSKQYEYTVNGKNGKIKEKDMEIVHIVNQNTQNDSKANTNSNNAPVSLDDAKATVVKDAGFEMVDVEFLKEEFDKEDNDYDIEFIKKNDDSANKYTYEYTVDAKSGKIINKEKDPRP